MSKPTIADLHQSIMATINAPGAAPQLQINRKGTEGAYEVYVFCLVLKAVNKAGGTYEMRGAVSGPNPPRLVFRGSPGHMYSQAQDFAYAHCQVGNEGTFEVHLGVQYTGGSKAKHEVDISLYDDHRAQIVRKNFILPDTNKLRAAIECKCYAGALGTSLGRTFVGLVDDCGDLVFSSFATNGDDPQLRNYLAPKNRPQPHFQLFPLHNGLSNSEDRFIGYVSQQLTKWGR